jgi:hypothetical protein
VEKCEKCGAEVEIGEWPYCPHGKPTLYVSHSYYDYTLRETVNSGPGGRRAQLMKERKLEFLSPKIGMPGCEI